MAIEASHAPAAFLTIREVAGIIGVSEPRAYSLAAENFFPVVRTARGSGSPARPSRPGCETSPSAPSRTSGLRPMTERVLLTVDAAAEVGR